MTDLFKDILLIIIFVFVLLMFLTLIVNLFFTKAPYVPSSHKIIQKIFDQFPELKGKKVYDLGCGDGRFLFWAEQKYQIQGMGYELAPLPYLLAHLGKLIYRSNTKIIWGDFFKTNLADAEIIFCYLYPEIVNQVWKKAKKECKPGTLLISNTFKAKDAEPIKVIYDQKQKPQIYLYQI